MKDFCTESPILGKRERNIFGGVMASGSRRDISRSKKLYWMPAMSAILLVYGLRLKYFDFFDVVIIRRAPLLPSEPRGNFSEAANSVILQYRC